MSIVHSSFNSSSASVIFEKVGQSVKKILVNFQKPHVKLGIPPSLKQGPAVHVLLFLLSKAKPLSPARINAYHEIR